MDAMLYHRVDTDVQSYSHDMFRFYSWDYNWAYFLCALAILSHKTFN